VRVSKKKPWAAPKINKAKRKLSRLTRYVHGTSTLASKASYRDKAQLTNLKRLIGKLKTHLENAQRTNVELADTLRNTRETLVVISSNILEAHTALNDIIDLLPCDDE